MGVVSVLKLNYGMATQITRLERRRVRQGRRRREEEGCLEQSQVSLSS